MREKEETAHFLTDPYIKASVRIPAHVLYMDEVAGHSDIAFRQLDAFLFPATAFAIVAVVVVVV